MSSIVTFYSYKGGVGRSMALANVAVLLAQRGMKVLAVDWDLEAPGLERYFSYFEMKQTGPGLLRMCMKACEHEANYKDFSSTIDCKTPHPITLLLSGRESDESYTTNLEAFDWETFFSKRGGAFVEQLREQWKKDFDVTLIDSRTGLSDTGGICTIQLPDIVVGMFTANLQSLYGVRDVMRLAQQARQRLAYDRMPLSVFPLPARWGVQEFQETQVWLDRIADATKEFYEDWLPTSIPSREVLEAVKIPQIAFFGFGERLAVVEQGTSDPQGMGFAYAKVASFIATDFKEVDALMGERLVLAPKATATRTPNKQLMKIEATDGYLYDVFFSHDITMSELVLEFTDRVKLELTSLHGDAPPKTFIDVQEIRAGKAWADRLSEALVCSKVLVAFVTPSYIKSRFASQEFKLFSDRSRMTGNTLLVPVILRGDVLPQYVKEYNGLDLRRTALMSSAQRSSETSHQARLLAKRLDRMIAQAPKFDPSWIDLVKGFYSTKRRVSGPVVIAKFWEDANGGLWRKSRHKVSEIAIELWVDRAPLETEKVKFEILADVNDATWTVKRARRPTTREFITEVSLWGNVDIIARGIGSGNGEWTRRTDLYDSLLRYYRRKTLSRDVQSALAQIRDN